MGLGGFLFPRQARKLILILTIGYPSLSIDDGSSGDLCRFVVYWEVDYKEGYPEDPNFYFSPCADMLTGVFYCISF